MNANERESEVQDDAPPFDFGSSEVDKKGQRETRYFQIVDALSQMFIREPVRAFKLDEQALIDNQVGCVFPDHVTFVRHAVGDLRATCDPAEGQFLCQSAFVDLFEKAGAERVRYLVCGSDDGFKESV